MILTIGRTSITLCIHWSQEGAAQPWFAMASSPAPTELDSDDATPLDTPPDDIDVLVSKDDPYQRWLDRAREEEEVSLARAALEEEAHARSRSPERPLPLAESSEEDAPSPLPSRFDCSASRSAGSGSRSAVLPLPGAAAAATAGGRRRVFAQATSALHSQWSVRTAGRVSVQLSPHGIDPFQHCCSLIDHDRRAFYVGITEDPVARWLGSPECPGHQHRFQILIVCYEAKSSADTAALERRLIGYYQGRTGGILDFGNLRCLNIGGGGERPSVGSPHFLYIAFRENELLRR